MESKLNTMQGYTMISPKDIIFSEINGSRLDTPSAKPHKLLLLLAVARLYEKAILIGNHIEYDDALCCSFSEVFSLYARDDDRKRPYTPFFHLKTMSFWTLIAREGKRLELANTNTIGGPKQLMELVAFAEINETFVSVLCNKEDNFELQALISNKLTSYRQLSTQGDSPMNRFVSYLNSLHCTDANSKGGLAESQALEPLFCEIQVSHPWSAAIFNTLVGSGIARVILSGHAGDGKSILAIELIKRLKGIPPETALSDGLMKKETIHGEGKPDIVVVKDLSEWREEERDELFQNLLTDTSRSYLLVSNTGTLLDFFKRRHATIDQTQVQIENVLLTALDSEQIQTMVLGTTFQVCNLAQMDNIALAMQLFDRMVGSTAWSDCEACAYHEKCPIAANREILRKYNDPIRKRIWQVYYRTYAYGQRMTMRQISAHFAYIITGGLDCSAVGQDQQCGRVPQLEETSFANRFWGDNGWEPDVKASQLRAIRVFESQSLNTQFSPAQERDFWQPEGGGVFNLGIPELQECVSRLQKIARSSSDTEKAICARRQLRRLAYFLYRPNENKTVPFTQFQKVFLDSPTILDYQAWQENPAALKAREIQPALFGVLQEQFCGMLPPEGTVRNGELYITLNRQRQDIRQSSQLVLRHFKFSAMFDVRMEAQKLFLVGKGAASKIKLPITLPFLDYIVSRKSGELGRGLQISYRDRLEKLMAQLLKLLPEDGDDALMLLRQGEDGSLSTIVVKKNNDMLEVSND